MVHIFGSLLIRKVNLIEFLDIQLRLLPLRQKMPSHLVTLAGDRGARSFKELTELFAGNGMIGFVAKERVDGKIVSKEAVQILPIKATA